MGVGPEAHGGLAGLAAFRGLHEPVHELDGGGKKKSKEGKWKNQR
jgi:hypothetical protein